MFSSLASAAARVEAREAAAAGWLAREVPVARLGQEVFVFEAGERAALEGAEVSPESLWSVLAFGLRVRGVVFLEFVVSSARAARCPAFLVRRLKSSATALLSPFRTRTASLDTPKHFQSCAAGKQPLRPDTTALRPHT